MQAKFQALPARKCCVVLWPLNLNFLSAAHPGPNAPLHDSEGSDFTEVGPAHAGSLLWVTSHGSALTVNLCLLGVKIQIQSLNGEHLHIREFHRVKVGDIATGISSQVRTQVTLRVWILQWEGFQISRNGALGDSGLWLSCPPGPRARQAGAVGDL